MAGAILVCCKADETIGHPKPTSKPPNILLLLADDLGIAHPSVYSGDSSEIHTPFIDTMAAEGMLFTQFYSGFHICSPSRASLLTGRLPIRMGIVDGVFTPLAVGGLPLNETSMATALKKAGYTTALIGKYHLGVREEFSPLKHGFDEYYGVPISVDEGLSAWRPSNYKPIIPFQPSPLPLMRSNNRSELEIIEAPTDLALLSKKYVERASSYIKEHANKEHPFFLFVSFNHVHAPIFSSKEFCNTSSRGPIGDGVQDMDHAIGEIMAALKLYGIDNDTITFFTSDNGGSLASDCKGNLPFRDGKRTTWEGGILEPAIVRWPGKIPAGKVTQELAASYDIFPTVMRLANVPLPTDRIIDGKDMSPILFEDKHSLHTCLFHYHDSGENGSYIDPVVAAKGLFAVRCGRYKAHYATYSTVDECGKTPPVPDGFHDPPILYDLYLDPTESNPISNKTREYRDAMEDIEKARAEHLQTLSRVPNQLFPPYGGSDIKYILCSFPESYLVYPKWPNCTVDPWNWAPPPCL